MKLRHILVTGLALFALPAVADIAAYNAAIQKRDYKAAAAEARATWPTLDKNRADIEVIAVEFAFANMMGGDAKTAAEYAAFAIERHTGKPDKAEPLAVARMLHGAARLELDPGQDTRREVFDSLSARLSQPGIDRISMLAADRLVSADYKRRRWDDAKASSDVAARLLGQAGPEMRLQAARYELSSAVAGFMGNRSRPQSLDPFFTLQKSLYAAIDGAQTDDAAKPYIATAWETFAWRHSVASVLSANAGARVDRRFETLSEELDTSGRRARLMHQHGKDDPCRRMLSMTSEPSYPSTAVYNGIVGTIILQVDVTAEGRAENPAILAAVPEKHFGEAVLKSVGNIRFKPNETTWNASCAMAEKGHVITFQFRLP